LRTLRRRLGDAGHRFGWRLLLDRGGFRFRGSLRHRRRWRRPLEQLNNGTGDIRLRGLGGRRRRHGNRSFFYVFQFLDLR